MITHFVSITLCVAGATLGAMSQTASVQPSQPNSGRQAGTYSYNAVPQPGNGGQNGGYNQSGGYNSTRSGAYNPNQSPVGGVLFSNRTGQAYSAQDLAAQLQNLRSAIDQTLPILSAFNESYSNSNNSGRETVGGALSGIVSDVLHRNQSSGQSYAGQSSTTSNLLAALHGLLSKNNSSAAAPASTPNPQDLVSLQSDLEPVLSVLQKLNVNGSSNQITAPYPNGGFAPTGR